MSAAGTCGIYIHVPFCVSKCCYCDFASFPHMEDSFEPYKNALVNELRAYAEYTEIDSVFIGGGTPTALPPAFIEKILSALPWHKIRSDAEITTEANPATLSRDMLKTLRSSGVNRLSIGLQAWQDKLLQTLSRTHTQMDFLDNYSEARAAGFDNINVDLIFSIPGQTTVDWEETLVGVTALKPQHISAYSLSVEDNTPLAERISSGKCAMPSDESDREMYRMLKTFLSDYGYEHYEISNFAKPGKYSRHNLRYWERGSYIGFGLGAHSFTPGRPAGERCNNTYDLRAYIGANGDRMKTTENILKISEKEAISETMFLGLRMIKGVDRGAFFAEHGRHMDEVFGVELKKLTDEGLLADDGCAVALTEKGLDLANIVFMEFI